jgi:hypothetical protein
MSATTPAEISRRGFIKSTASVAGGLVIACYLPGCSKPEQAARNAGPPKLIKANAWLQIGTDGSITMLCDKSEMGQALTTSTGCWAHKRPVRAPPFGKGGTSCGWPAPRRALD